MRSSLNNTLRSLFSGGGILFIGLIIELGLSFLAKAIIARFLGAVDYGAVSLGVTMLGLLSTLSLLGLHTGVSRYLPRFEDDADRRGVLMSAATMALPVVGVTGLLVGVFAGPIAGYLFSDPTVTPIIRVFGLAIPFAAVMKFSIGVIRGIEQAIPRVVVQNIVPPVTRFFAVAVAIVLGTGVIGIATAYAAAYVVAALVGLYYVVTRTSLLANKKPKWIHKEMLSFSAPLIVSAAMAYVLTDLDTFMLGYFSSTRDVGIYNVVYPIAQLLTVGLSAFGFLFLPVISELDSDGADREIHRVYQIVTKWIFMATLPVFMVIALFPEMTITITFGREYVSGSVALSLLAVAYFSHAIAGPNANTLTSIGHTRLIMWDNLVVGIINAILNVALIPTYGFLGAGIATAISYIVLNLLYSTQLYRRTGIHPFSTGLIRPGIIAIALTTITFWITRTFFSVTIPLLVAMFTVFLFAYGLIILRFGGIEEEEIMLVLSFEDRFDIDLGPLKKFVKLFIQ
ncbi:flippase [Halorubrum distributum]|nr:flippase [Halorubrum terrestre]